MDLRQPGRGGLYRIVAVQYAIPEIEMPGGAVVGVVLVDKGADVVKEIPAQAAGLLIQNLPGQGQPQLSLPEGVADLGQMCRIPQNARLGRLVRVREIAGEVQQEGAAAVADVGRAG